MALLVDSARGMNSPETQSPDLSPPRRTRHDSPDLSPPRQSSTLHSNGASPDLSPPRRQRHDSSGSDLSPPRRGSKKPNQDLSPPRRKKRPDSRSSVRHRTSSPEILEAWREREKFFKEMDSEISGRKAETVYRKDGVKLDPRLERIRKKKEEMKKMEEDERFMQWGRG